MSPSSFGLAGLFGQFFPLEWIPYQYHIRITKAGIYVTMLSHIEITTGWARMRKCDRFVPMLLHSVIEVRYLYPMMTSRYGKSTLPCHSERQRRMTLVSIG